MKLSFLVSCMSLFIYVLQLPIQQFVSLHRADAAFQAGNLESAMAYVEGARSGGLQFYARRTNSVCGDITLARARRLADGTDPDFGGAAGLLRDLAARCGTSGRDGEAARLRDRLVTQHLARACSACSV